MARTGIGDITWSAMGRAGIDTDLVTRQPTELGVDVYVLIDGDLKVAFGPGVDMENGGTFGYDVCFYHADGEDWFEFAQNWAETVDDLLRMVALANAS